ncbi:WD domain, G-beta repeat [Novymonas esmeraldas]|uniref:WD domain, G-beta repeat n=1 Tax=Novymonas esmeraldas TaxID=1808958 RepID=A0AAW0F500_9TRYP
MWSADLNPDGVAPGCLCVARDTVWWVSTAGWLYSWRAAHATDAEATDPIAVAQVDRRAQCLAVSLDGTRVVVLSATSVVLLETRQTPRPRFLSGGGVCGGEAGGLGDDALETVTATEVLRLDCALLEVRALVLNPEATLAAVCTAAGLCLLTTTPDDYADGNARCADECLTRFDCAHLGASAPGCSMAVFSGSGQQLLVADDVNHLLLLHGGGTDADGADGVSGPVGTTEAPATSLCVLVDGHICTRTARVTALACGASGPHGESVAVVGLSTGTVQLLHWRTLQPLRSWCVLDTIAAAVAADSLNAAAASGRRRSRPSQLAGRTRLGAADGASADRSGPASVRLHDVAVGARLIAVCTSHGVVYYSRATLQPEHAYTQLLPAPLAEAAAMRVAPNGRWAATNITSGGVLYFSPRDIDTRHTLESCVAEESVADEDLVHARAPLPAAWLGGAAGLNGALAAASGAAAKAQQAPLTRRPVKSSGYTDAPWSVQQDRKRRAQVAAARDRRAQAFGAVSASAAASTGAPRFDGDLAALFGVGSGGGLARAEAATAALQGLHARAVLATTFTTAGDALVSAGGDGRLQQLHFPIARSKGAGGLAGYLLAGHTGAVTAVDANLSRQRRVLLTGGADGTLRLWAPGTREAPIAECSTGSSSISSSGAYGGRTAAANAVVAAQFFYLDTLVLSCAGAAMELRRHDASLSQQTLPQSPVYQHSVGSGHTVTSATAVNHFASNLVFLATSEREVQVLDVAADTVLWRHGAAHTRGIYRVATGRTSRYVAADAGTSAAEHLFLSASLDSSAVLWDVRTAKPAQLFTQHTNTALPSLAMEMAPGSGVVAVASQDNAVYMYDLRGGGGGVALDVLRGFDSYATALAWHPLRPALAVGLASGDIHILQPPAP